MEWLIRHLVVASSLMQQDTGANSLGQFFNRIYTTLLLPVAVPIGVLMFVIGGVMFMLGRRDGLERMVGVGIALFLIGFGPFLINWIFNTARALGGS